MLNCSDVLIMMINEQLISRGVSVANSSLNETCYKMIENLNSSVKKYSDKKMSFLGTEFENQIYELKK
jgi:hypothetical protein